MPRSFLRFVEILTHGLYCKSTSMWGDSDICKIFTDRHSTQDIDTYTVDQTDPTRPEFHRQLFFAQCRTQRIPVHPTRPMPKYIFCACAPVAKQRSRKRMRCAFTVVVIIGILFSYHSSIMDFTHFALLVNFPLRAVSSASRPISRLPYGCQPLQSRIASSCRGCRHNRRP